LGLACRERRDVGELPAITPQSHHSWYILFMNVDHEREVSVEHGEVELLSVRETARRLGVHENTVRNWARDGILPTARLPGSRFHRFDARDVERLRQQRGSIVSSIEQERRTIGPELVDATQLSHWATTQDAHYRFPELMRRLLASTPGITNISLRSGEGVSAPGWDGRADSIGAAYLPSGSLCFEFGVSRQPKVKADEDYEKRRDDPQGVVPADVTFVFVTPRRWSGAATWANTRRAEGVFADVRVLDADDLEGWLQATPAVHHWISELLGRRPSDAETLERWWARFQAQTDPALPAALFLVGRDRERQQLTEFLTKPPNIITVQAAWRNEAIAFVSATIEAIEREASKPVQPPLIVSSAEVWDRLAIRPGQMTLLPLFENPDIATAQQRGHHVIFPIGREQVAREAGMELPRPDRQGAVEVLEAAGVNSERAYELAALARRSMPSLVRTLARDPRFARPPWSQPPAVTILAPLVLVGAWTAKEADTNIVSRMANEQWPMVERTLLHWRSTDDPPFVRSGSQWHLASAEEAFLVLRDALTSSDLRRWRQIAVEVLLETDPKLELPLEERSLAAVKGVARQHSSVLRRGLAEGIALVGSLGNERLSDGLSGADHARRVVHEIVNRAGDDLSGQIWRSLADVLPLLAEAAPEEFLAAVYNDLDREESLLSTMFQDTDHGSLLYSSSSHTGLLWALETLCWSPEYLLDASRALAHLHVVDPGGRLSNRPLESLQSVLAGWIRHTAASLDLKVQAVEQICRRLPDVGWRLILGLWPGHATLSPPAAPRFRDWKPESRNVLISEWIEYIKHLVQLAIGLAGARPERWAELSEHLGPLPPTERARLLQALDRFADPDSLTSEQRLLLWERLQKEVIEHRRFATADWSMDENSLSVMQTIANRLEPTSNVERFGYLFDWHPDLPDVDPNDYVAYEARLLELRSHAVRETLDLASTEGLRRLAERSPVASHLGWVVGAVAPESLTPELLTWLDSENPKLRDVAANWASHKLQENGVGWLFAVLARPDMASAARRNALMSSVPSSSEFWDALAQVDAELLSTYWQGMHSWRLSPQDADRAARELLRHDRAWAAVDLLGTMLHHPEGSSSIKAALVQEVLDAALSLDPKTEGRLQSLGYQIGVLLDYLDAQEFNSERLADYEFVWLPLLEHYRQPRALFRVLSRDPSAFVHLVSRAYRGRNEPRRQLNEQEEALAHRAWWVLHHWHGLPGRRENETVDGEYLKQWVRDARLALAELNRADIGDEQIGQILSASPLGTDNIWPAEPVRDLLETIGSPSIETGVHLGVINQRGVITRGVYEGGQQERALAARYRQWARQTAANWPRTSRVLRGLAESYERQAQHEDAQAEVIADTE
jgi:excisionase family DNA binding protein